MAGNLRAQQNLAECFANVLMKFEFEGGSREELAHSVGEEVSDLRRWAGGTKMPAHVFRMLIHALPLHLADELIRGERRLIPRGNEDAVNILHIASGSSALSSEITGRHADDGQFCHRDRAAVIEKMKKHIADLEAYVREAGAV